MPETDDLQNAITDLTAALISESPNWQDGALLATARGVLVILLKLQQEGA